LLQAQLNDSHPVLIVHWAGESSDVIIALAKYSPYMTSSARNSRLYISENYGANFTDITDRARGINTNAVIDKYYNSDLQNNHVS
jgi:hypothetical protein